MLSLLIASLYVGTVTFLQIPIRPHRWSTRHRPAAERFRGPGTTGSGMWFSILSPKPRSELPFLPQGDSDDLADGAPSVPAALAGAAAADAQRRHGRRGRRPRRGRRRLLQQQLVQRRRRPHETLRGGRQGAGAAAADLHPKQLKASQGMVRVIGEPDCLAVTRREGRISESEAAIKFAMRTCEGRELAGEWVHF